MTETVLQLRMLVVDDDDVDRERVRRLLTRGALDVDIVEASSGEEALALVRQHAFDCVVLDNHLGDASGAALLPQLRREARQGCPVIMITGAGSEALAVQALTDGASDYLAKTQLSAEGLVRSVRRSVEHHRARTERDARHEQLAFRVETQATTLRQRERDLSVLIDNAPAVMGYWDREQRCRFGNQTHGEWFDVDALHLPGSRLQDVLGTEFYQVCSAAVQAALSGRPQNFETTVARRQGRPERHVQVQLRPDVMEEGGVQGFYATMTDVTPIKIAQARAEELLRFSEAVIENSPIGISVFRTNGTCVLANAAFLAACGEGPEALLSRGFRLGPAWLGGGMEEQARATLADGVPRRIDIALSGVEGRDVQLACALARVDRGGEPHVLLIAHNVTEQRQAHAALIAARDAATSAARAKSAFLANMSHEIRTPMNAIVGLSRLALEDELPSVARDYLDKVHTSAMALLGILDDVLDYSKIEAGHMHFERIRFNLCDTLQRVTDLFQARIEQKAIGFCFELSPRTPRHVFGDPLRLSQVLNNLVSNAIKFTDAGQVRVKVDVAIDPQSPHLLRFSVSDTGIGIDAKACASLFEAFVQGDDSVTRRFGGTGLGLAICKRLVEMMGGTIGVISELGQGSEFWFTASLEAIDDDRVSESPDPAPLVIGQVAPAQVCPVSDRAKALASLAAPLRGAHLLLAEDNPLNQIVAREFLHRAGLDVTVVADGASAVQAIESAAPGQFAAILMDLHMPVMDGFEATRRIRALPVAEGVPVIGMTAAVLAEDRLRCTEAGMVDHISKPVIPERLIQVLLKWVPVGLPADLDLSSARQRLQGNQGLLWRLLETFMAQEADAGRLIAGMLAQGLVEEARAKVHDLKGGASTVGAKAIAAACADLEAAMSSGVNVEVMSAALQARLTSGLGAIQKCLAERKDL